MTKALSKLGFITALLGTILAVTKFYNYAVIPLLMAFVFGILVLLKSKNQQHKPKSIQYIFLLVIISLGFFIYKSHYTNTAQTKESTPPTIATDSVIPLNDLPKKTKK